MVYLEKTTDFTSRAESLAPAGVQEVCLSNFDGVICLYSQVYTSQFIKGFYKQALISPQCIFKLGR